MAIKYDDHNTVINLLTAAQDVEKDNRANVKEVQIFLTERNGQWEDDVFNATDGRPRYTFDKCNPIVDSITQSIESSDFVIKVDPADGAATDDLAKTYNGMIRAIQNMSDAKNIYNQVSRQVVMAGLGGARVVQDWTDANSFDQDLIIKPISNYVDRVWFDPTAEMQDQSDAEYVFVLQALSKSEYEDKFPKGSGMPVGQAVDRQTFTNVPDVITVGEVLYKKPTTKTLLKMSDGSILERNEKNESILDDLALRNPPITIERERKRDTFTVHQRFFDGEGWLGDEKETVFDLLPVVPEFGNFIIIDNKVLYWGAVDKLLDQQRVYNYIRSRQVEEGALAPREKIMATPAQIQGHESTFGTLNTNADPVQLYNHVNGEPAPYKMAGNQNNQGLEASAQAASADINASAGQFGANLANNPNMQSGVALDTLQAQGNANNTKYFQAREIFQCGLAKVLIGAIPKAYDSTRQVRILGEDSLEEIIAINKPVRDEQTGNVVMVNDLKQGKYGVVCTSGQSFSNRQDATVKAFVDVAAIDPTILQSGGDVLFANMTQPGMDVIAKRKRREMLLSGLILEEEQTDDEKQLIQQMQEQQAQQGQEPDAATQANLMFAQAEQAKAEADQAQVQVNANKAQVELQEKQIKLSLDGERLQLDRDKFEASVFSDQEKAGLAEQKQQMAQVIAIANQQSQEITDLKTQAETFKIWREGQGVETIVGPHVIEATINTADLATQAQEAINPDLAGTELVGDDS